MQPPAADITQPSAKTAASVRPFESDPTAAESVARMRERNPKADPLGRIPDVHPGRIPRHIAIIMDGNGRWAEQRGFPRVFGHRNGAAAVRDTVEECGRLGVECLTLYSFSSENWKRPREEIDALMALCVMYVQGECDAMLREGVRFRVIGSREGLPAEVVGAIESTERATEACRAATLCLAINYGSRAELVEAARSLARDARAGTLNPDSIDEGALSSRLWTADLPDPDLLIRTAGERRLSNFLLWQLSYAELYVTDTLWPEFGIAELHRAVRDYAARERRFGGV
jgi:undecaprenyl diphosphate synthase